MSRPPSPCSRMRTAAARAQVNVPRRWMVMTASKSSSVIFHSTLSRRMPALVTRTSSRPNSSTARSTSRSAASVVPTGTTSATAVPPASVIDCDGLLGDVRVDVVDDDGGAVRRRGRCA